MPCDELCPGFDEAAPGDAGARQSLLRLVLIALAIALLAVASPLSASAAGPKPDPAPVKTTPKPAPRTPPVSNPAPSVSTTRSSTSTTPSTKRTVTTGRKHKTVKTRHKKPARKPAPAHIQTTTKPPAGTVKPKPHVVPTAPAATSSPGLRARISSLFKVSLLTVGVLLLALAALEPRLVRPPHLRKALIDHRGDLAAAGILMLLGVGIAYLIVWGSAF